MLIGYARTSTVEQVAGLEAQERDLRVAGADKLFAEQTSSVGARPQLEAAIDFAREGDTIVVTRLDRLARSVRHLLEIVERLNAKKVSLRILGMGIDTSTPTGRLMLQVVGAIGQFEREIMLERQREGIAKAKGEGRYKGRAPTARAKAADIRRLAAEGLTKQDIADQLGIGVASVYRVLSQERLKEGGWSRPSVTTTIDDF
ncbi:recombinase family protein [Methylocystis sp. IM3]|uniref:recombinase family protein n=1 Tax=unclassified Methylocystis TaxID=2625913 RepID=UPI0030FC6023